MGATPIRGFTIVPSNAATGDFCAILAVALRSEARRTHPVERCLLQLTTGLVRHHQAQIVDALLYEDMGNRYGGVSASGARTDLAELFVRRQLQTQLG